MHNIRQCIINAMVVLEEGGKYDWNDSLQKCYDWLEDAIKLIDETIGGS